MESENVLGMMGSVGTASQAAVQKYLNGRKVPQLLVSSAASRFNQPKVFPWTTPNSGDFQVEGRAMGRHIAATRPDAKIALIYPADELGRDFVRGLKAGLGDRAGQIVTEETYETSSPTVDSQLVKLAASGADVFVNGTIGKFTSQSVRKAHELGWKPEQYVTTASASVSLLKPAGVEASNGILALRYMRSVGSPQWADDPAVKDYQALRAEFLPNVDPDDNTGFYGYSSAILMHRILEKCGDDLTRDNLLKVATDLRGWTVPVNLPGITLATRPDDYAIYRTYRLSRYENNDWVGIQDVSAG
ncbi:ABC transporter substrate-binding protein [Camelimonas abortus]|uniref:ABC transporter substrate-binding protein n=1 Tax=Camelimonas abortus TaxID=1017184 RepID=A0ABV7LD02_9HYPH